MTNTSDQTGEWISCFFTLQYVVRKCVFVRFLYCFLKYNMIICMII